MIILILTDTTHLELDCPREAARALGYRTHLVCARRLATVVCLGGTLSGPLPSAREAVA